VAGVRRFQVRGGIKSQQRVPKKSAAFSRGTWPKALTRCLVSTVRAHHSVSLPANRYSNNCLSFLCGRCLSDNRGAFCRVHLSFKSEDRGKLSS
jgi:hypothetical protein